MNKLPPEYRNKLLAAGGMASIIGGAAYALARQRQGQHHDVTPQPEILNSNKIDPEKRWRINQAGMFVLCAYQPTRAKLMKEYDLARHKADFCLGYLTQYGLIARLRPTRQEATQPYYVPAQELAETLADPTAYPMMEQALQERISRRPSTPEN